ncbi:MAG: hypothetical protein A3H44_12945 [Gammaproteobacteria bacterium RIFCSPLOWO2_02_FULL_57_10]|nr:MAG: hypothetical protein A3H44_12945 [Gammaproteobacteria bacterium RIFCSPLOWO2_02_FULL_57_10]
MAATFEYRFHPRIADIDPDIWNSLANNASPFLRYEFLSALERTQCVCADTGWQPYHLTVSQGDKIVAAMPLYIKSHSYGEYVFDWSWADAYRQHGRRYYPKLLTAIPFTPSHASRLLIAQGEDIGVITAAIAQRVIEEARHLGASSWHVLFPTPAESARLAQLPLQDESHHKLHPRIATQFHWFNRGYTSFDHYLESFNSRKRKNLRKEREAVRADKIHFERFRGNAITDDLWRDFYRFYQNTYQVRGQQGYLSLDFFRQLGVTMPDNILMVVATRDGHRIAAALSLRDDTRLYGRYWGSLQESQFLHFETCYYQGIEYCIEHGLQSFDSGAQGEHKIQRGFEPIITHSNHWIADAQFDAAIGDFLVRERQYVVEYRDDTKKSLPFKM